MVAPKVTYCRVYLCYHGKKRSLEKVKGLVISLELVCHSTDLLRGIYRLITLAIDRVKSSVMLVS